MTRTLVVAHIRPGAVREVARIFAAADAASPVRGGVRQRSLYSLDDIYLHLVDVDDAGAPDRREMPDRAHALGASREVSDELARFVRPYDSTWGRPHDSVATEFYRWHAAESCEGAHVPARAW